MQSRIWSEWNQYWNEPLANVIIGMNNNDIRSWTATITGPQDTPYYGGLFFVRIEFPEDYPESPPKMKMMTPIYHMNIAEDGEICLNILKKGYSPSLSIGYMISSLIYLLGTPNPMDPLRGPLGYQYMERRAEYLEVARKHTLANAM